jgi:hypothetical protein
VLPISEHFSVSVYEADKDAEKDDWQEVGKGKIFKNNVLAISEKALAVIFVNKVSHIYLLR